MRSTRKASHTSTFDFFERNTGVEWDHRIWVETAVLEIAGCFFHAAFLAPMSRKGSWKIRAVSHRKEAWGVYCLSLAGPIYGDSFCTPPKVALQPSPCCAFLRKMTSRISVEPRMLPWCAASLPGQVQKCSIIWILKPVRDRACGESESEQFGSARPMEMTERPNISISNFAIWSKKALRIVGPVRNRQLR